MRKRERASLREHRNEEGRGCTENVLPVPSPVPSLFPSLFAQQCTESEHVILLFSYDAFPPLPSPSPHSVVHSRFHRHAGGHPVHAI